MHRGRRPYYPDAHDMSRLLRIEVQVETLVDELYAYVADPTLGRQRAQHPVLEELDGPGTLGMDPEVLETMRADGVHRRDEVEAFVAWSLAACSTATPRAIRRVTAKRPTRREADVLRLIAVGRTNPEIAASLEVSRHTVKRHIDNLYAKLGISSRAQAAAWAQREGFA